MLAVALAHTIFLEALGKGGIWGLGYDLRITERISAGIVGSAMRYDDQQIVSATPYLSVTPIGHRHRWFIDAGPHIAHTKTMSPFPDEWDGGPAKNGVSLEISSGYELRGEHMFVHAYVMAAIGSSFSPWLGTSVGWTF